jgi:gluconolactonase
MPEMDVKSPKLTELVKPDAAWEKISTGAQFTEGPVWNPKANYLTFSDMPGDTRRRWDPVEGTIVVRQPSNKCNGLAYDAQGRLVVCEHSTSRLVREELDGSITVLASHYDGKELNSPNDVIVTNNGTIFFSDPTYGRWPGFGLERETVMGFQGLYMIPPSGRSLKLVAGDFGEPNGLCMSPDEKLLYVNDTAKAHIRVFPMRKDGTPGKDTMFFEHVGTGALDKGVVDGMKCDAKGNIWVSGPWHGEAGGIWVISPKGEKLGEIHVPENVGNLCFGGPKWSTLFVAASTSVYRLETQVKSAPTPNTTR